MSAKRPKQLSRFIHYILGRHPEEFAVVTDPEGWVSAKTVLKVLNEEDGWRHVRIGHLKEVLLTQADADFEMVAGMLRAVDRSHLPMPEPAVTLPKMLYTAVRRRAYPRVAQRGIAGSDTAPVVLCREPDLAQRMGRRIDAEPVQLTVNTDQAQRCGVGFWTAGDGLFTATDIPAGCFSGPPVPEPAVADRPRKAPAPEPPPTPGSFILDGTHMPPSTGGSGEKRRKGRHKQRREVPPWRR